MSGIFGLSTYNDQNLAGLIPDKTRESYREYGYFGGGRPDPGTFVSIVDRVDYSNDTSTASVRGPLSSARYAIGATGNSNFGYFGGGYVSGVPIPKSTIDRIDYSNDNQTASVRGPLSLGRYAPTATGNSNFGYFSGGLSSNSSVTSTSTIQRIDYSNDNLTSTVRSSLSANRYQMGGTGNSNFGYFGGGSFPATTNFSNVFRLSYSSDTETVLIRGPISLSRNRLRATGNSNFGYFGGGYVSGVPIPESTIDRIDYSNDTATASVRGPLSLARNSLSATGNSNFGYFGGGRSPAVISTIDRIDYSNDTATASARGPLSSARNALGATSSHSFGGSPISQYGVFPKPFGYFVGTYFPLKSTIDRIDYSNDTANSSLRGNINQPKFAMGATGNSNFGWFAGGDLGPGVSSTIERIEYSNDLALASIRSYLNTPKRSFDGVGNENYGWFGGGYSPEVSTTERIDYSNDEVSPLIRGPLTVTTHWCSSVGNKHYGYWTGGWVNKSTTSRLDFSNDTQTAITRGPLPIGASLMGASDNQNYGYFAGAFLPSFSTISRIDFANDTTTDVRSKLSSVRWYLAGTGNQQYGYFSGGATNLPLSSWTTKVDRIDYNNDTSTASLRGKLVTANFAYTAVSPTQYGGAFDFQPTSTFFDIQSMRRIEDTTNESVKKRVLGSYGYFGGSVSPIRRLDYSNDNTTFSSRGSLSSSRAYPGATGNSNFGYFGGGGTPVSTVDRIDYSNDSATTSVRGPLSSARAGLAATGTSNFGYFGGSNSIIDRIDYSNDNQTASVRGPLSLGRYYLAAAGNSNFGYFVAGYDGANYTTIVNRVMYSNDLVTTSIRGALNVSRGEFAGVGNDNYGWFGWAAFRTSRIDRIDYSNDTVLASVRGASTINRWTTTGIGNNNFGYITGGYPGGNQSVEKINYSNDTVNVPILSSASLGVSTYGFAATTNARNS